MKNRLLASAAAVVLVAGAAQAQDLLFPVGEGDFHWDSFNEFDAAYDLAGETLTVFGPWRGEDQVLVENMLAYFAAATGATTVYSSSESYEQQIVIDLEGGSPANISVLPQPGLIANLASQGFVTPLPEGTAEWMNDNYAAGSSWVKLGSYAGPDGADQFYAFPYKADVKSLVWYSPENFEDAGYEIPQTMEELIALSDQIVADGGTPWCIGLGSGGATGWPATDWVEDVLLRTAAPEVYDGWVDHSIPFSDPQIINAINTMGSFLRNDAYVAGGAGAVATTDFRDSPKGLFTSPPQCYMHRQASFIPAFFPEGTVVGEDADFFYFPAFAGQDLGRPVLGAGTLVFITKDSPAAQAFIAWLQTPIAHEVWMAQKGFLTPHNGVNTALFADPTLGKMNEILLNATTFRFDGSDLMPAAVGAGSFWTGMVDYAGGKSAEEVAAAIDASWPM